MFRKLLITLLLLVPSLMAQSERYGLGRAAAPGEIQAANITVFPDGRGLPSGKGTAERGQEIYKERCAECHNDHGEGREHQYPALTGGIGSLATAKPVKSVGSYWPYATTLWDYIHRAMPYDQPRSLSVDDVYAVTAFVLHLNGLVKLSDEMNERTVPAVRMPNRNGFVPDPRLVGRDQRKPPSK